MSCRLPTALSPLPPSPGPRAAAGFLGGARTLPAKGSAFATPASLVVTPVVCGSVASACRSRAPPGGGTASLAGAAWGAGACPAHPCLPRKPAGGGVTAGSAGGVRASPHCHRRLPCRWSCPEQDPAGAALAAGAPSSRHRNQTGLLRGLLSASALSRAR